MSEAEIREFISDLAVNGGISASTQTVALSALLFLYRDVLKKELPYVSNIERAPRRKKLPVLMRLLLIKLKKLIVISSMLLRSRDAKLSS